MNQIEFTEFLLYNKKTIVSDIKFDVRRLLKKKRYFKNEFLLEFNHKLPANIWIILRNYLMEELELSYLQTEEFMLECKLVGNFLNEDVYNEWNINNVYYRIAVINDYQECFSFIEYKQFGEVKIWDFGKCSININCAYNKKSIGLFLNYKLLSEYTNYKDFYRDLDKLLVDAPKEILEHIKILKKDK